MVDTIFSKIIAGEIPCHKIYENDLVLSFLDIHPMQEGHSLVIPKQSYETIFELPDNYASEILVAGKRVANSLKEVLNPDGFNFFQSNGKFAGQEIMHYHMHIVPRFESRGEPGVPNLFGYFETTNDKLAALAEKLRNAIN